MNEKLLSYKEKITSYWTERTANQKKYWLIAAIGIVVYAGNVR